MNELRFDRATYGAGSDTRAPCAQCQQPLEGQFFKWQGHAICSPCSERLAGAALRARSGPTFLKAVLLGGGTALACGIAYALFVHFSNIRLSLVTIGIAFAVAKVIRSASGGYGGRRYQLLAVVLTYFAATMGYLPEVISGLQESAKEASDEPAAGPSNVVDPAAAAPAAPPPAASASAKSDDPPMNLLFSIVALFALSLGVMLAAPFLAITTSPMGILIVAFGLWEAWKLTQGAPPVIEGPFRVAPSP